MKGLRIFGDYLFEYFVITLLLVLSFVLIIPFIPIFIGVVSYFRRKIDDRMFKDIFKPIKDNFKIIILFTIFELILLIFSALNIYYMNTNPEQMSTFMLFISYVGLIIGAYLLIHSPVVILDMKVNFRQLLFNSIFLIMGGFKNTLLCIVCVLAYVFIGIAMPYLMILGIYFIPFVISKFTSKNIIQLKAIRMNTTVAELTRLENQDDYLDENYFVNHEDEK